MSTITNDSAAARRRRQKALMRRRLVCLVVSASMLTGTALAINHFHQKSVQALNDEIESLSVQVTELTTRNQDLSAALLKSNERLRMFVDTTEVRGPEPTIYDIPLSEDLQVYTYTRCAEYGIEEHYELVLAMMWQESHFTPDLISKTNDYGIMQINKRNHEWLSDLLGTTDFLDVHQNIDAGTYIIAKLLRKYDDENKALMAYNMGERAASLNWQAGNYTNEYSRSVMAKREAIEANNYTAD